jgi:hypothetical protein
MALSMNERGRLGGLATFQRHGRQHMSAIGKKGFEATVARHWQGDRHAYLLFLAAREWHLLSDRLDSLRLAEEIRAGAAIACIELPWEDEGAPPF